MDKSSPDIRRFGYRFTIVKDSDFCITCRRNPAVKIRGGAAERGGYKTKTSKKKLENLLKNPIAYRF